MILQGIVARDIPVDEYASVAERIDDVPRPAQRRLASGGPAGIENGDAEDSIAARVGRKHHRTRFRNTTRSTHAGCPAISVAGRASWQASRRSEDVNQQASQMTDGSIAQIAVLAQQSARSSTARRAGVLGRWHEMWHAPATPDVRKDCPCIAQARAAAPRPTRRLPQATRSASPAALRTRPEPVWSVRYRTIENRQEHTPPKACQPIRTATIAEPRGIRTHSRPKDFLPADTTYLIHILREMTTYAARRAHATRRHPRQDRPARSDAPPFALTITPVRSARRRRECGTVPARAPASGRSKLSRQHEGAGRGSR